MAKKIVRGITDIKTISNQDLDTNNVNDLLSDGQHNYIHRKKNDGSEEYHNLTNNIKTIEAEDNGLLTVRNYNNSTNSAKLTVHHDPQKEQKIYSTDHTIEIVHGDNGTGELTNVDVNPAKVLEHDNLQTAYGISKITSGNTTSLGIEYTKVDDDFDLNMFPVGRISADKFTNAPQDNTGFLVSAWSDDTNTIQEAISLNSNKVFKRTKLSGTWGEWREQVGDKSVIDGLLAQKQNTLTASGGLTITGNTISFNVVDQFGGDLNDILYTCLAKPLGTALNLPDDDDGGGILQSNRIGFTISQQYHSIDGDKMYIRIGRNIGTSPTWTQWTLLSSSSI